MYERNGGTSCVDQLYAVYPDGRVLEDLGGGGVKTTQVTKDQVDSLLASIDDLGWYTDGNFVTTHHTPCGACFQYSLTVKYNGQSKTVGAVDGGVDAYAKYWLITAKLAAILPDAATQ